MEEGCGGEGRKRKEGRQPEEKEGVAEKARTAGDGPSTASVSGDGPSTASVSGDGPSTASVSGDGPSTASVSGDGPSTASVSGEEVSSQHGHVTSVAASEFSGQLSMQGGQGNIGSVQNSGSIGHLGHNFYNDNDRLQSIAARTTKNLEKACPQGYVKTSSYYRALGKVRSQGCCMITGTSGSGKTTLARHLLLAFRDKGFLPLELITPDECQCVPWQKVGDEKLRLVLLVDNVVGAGNFEDDLRRKWEIQLKPMKPFIECGNVLVILSSRANIYAAIRGVTKSDQVLYEAPEISLGGEDSHLSDQEKEDILGKTLAYHKAKPLDQMSIFWVIWTSKSVTKIGFPQLCVYLATNATALSDPVTFFQNPVKFLGGEFQKLKLDDKLSYFVLILVLLREGKLSEEFMKTKRNKEFFREVTDRVGLSINPGHGRILERAKQLCESFLEYDSQSKCFSFTHQSVWDVLFSDMCHSDFEQAASVCTFKQLVMYVRTDPKCEESEEFVYVVSPCDWPILANRLLQELTSGDADLACSHPCLQHPGFVQELLTDMNISTLLKTQRKKKTISFKYKKLNSMEGSATSAFPISQVTAFSIQSCISYLLLRRCSSAAKHILQSAQFQALSPTTQSQLLTEALVCALYVSDPDMVDWLLDRGAVPSQECVRAACCAEQEHIGLVERALQWDSVLSAELLTEMARVAWQKDRPRTLERVLSHLPKSAGTQAELDRILAEVISVTHPNKRYHCEIPFLRTHGTEYQPRLSHILSILKKAGAQFRTHIDPHTAAGHPDPSPLSEWLEHKVDLSVTDKYGYTLLHHAAQTGALSNVQALLEVMESTGQLAQLVNVRSRRGKTALHLAAEKGRLAVIETLLKKGADASVIEYKTVLSMLASCRVWEMEGYMSPSEDQMAASSSSHSSGFQSQAHDVNVMRVKDLLRMLVTNTISFEDSFFGNPRRMAFNEDQILLNEASFRGHCLLVEALVERGVDVNFRDGRGRTPVHWAAKSGHVDVLEVLSRNEAQLDIRDSKGQTALHVAARWGHLPVVEMLIQNKVNINTADKRERTPLHEAAEGGHDQVVKCLLDNGATVNAADKDGQQPLHLAAGGGHFSAVKCLVEGDASVNAKGRDGRTCLLVASHARDVSTLELLFAHGADVAVVDNSGNTMLHSLAASKASLCSWKSQADTARMASLVKSLGGLVNCQNKQGDTPVMLAVKYKNYKVLRELLRLQCDLSISNDAGDTVLHLAAAQEPWWGEEEAAEECMSTLPKKGVEVLYIENLNGDMPMSLAVRAGSFILLKEILKHSVDLFFKSKGGNTSLYEFVSAVSRSSISKHESVSEIVEKLVSKCPGSINSTNDEGDTPVLTAAPKGLWFRLFLFLKHSVNFSVKCKGGNSVLHELTDGLNAWEIERVRKVVEFLVERCADLINSTNDEGDTPALTAARKGLWFLLSLFLKQKCDVRACDRRGNTLLHCIAESTQPQQLQVTVQAIIADLADLVDRSNEDGDSALLVAARRGNAWMVRELVALQCNVRLSNKKGETALFLAINSGHSSMVEMLLEQDVDVNIKTEEESSLLHALAESSQLDHQYRESEGVRKMVHTLLEKCKSFASCPSIRGETPLYLAFLHGNWCVADLLLEQAGSSVDCREGGLTDKPQEATGLSLAQEGVRTPLHGLAASRDSKLKYDAKLIERVSLWVKRFYHWVNHPDPEGNTPILIALRKWNSCVAEQLVQCGADLSVTDAEGNTPILLALRNGHLSVAEKLIQCGVDLSVTDAEGNTPILLALREGHLSVAEKLIQCGADLSVTDAKGNTVLHVLTEKTVFNWYHNRVKDTKANEAVVVKVTELAKAAGVTPLTPNKEGKTALDVLRQRPEEIRKAEDDIFDQFSDYSSVALETTIHWFCFLRDLWLSEEK